MINHSELNSYQKFIKQRHIKYLIHFTKSSNLPFIFGNDKNKNGILSTQAVKDQFGSGHVWDKKRLDNQQDHVCCSVQRINLAYYRIRVKEEKERGDIFNQWVTVFVNPMIINNTSLFCPTNSARGSGKYITSGIDGFKSLFNDKVPGKGPDRNYLDLDPCFPTDYQAEVLIKNKIPKSDLLGVAFPNDSKDVEVKRLEFWSPKKIPVFPWKYCIYGFDDING